MSRNYKKSQRPALKLRANGKPVTRPRSPSPEISNGDGGYSALEEVSDSEEDEESVNVAETRAVKQSFWDVQNGSRPRKNVALTIEEDEDSVTASSPGGDSSLLEEAEDGDDEDDDGADEDEDDEDEDEDEDDEDFASSLEFPSDFDEQFELGDQTPSQPLRHVRFDLPPENSGSDSDSSCSTMPDDFIYSIDFETRRHQPAPPTTPTQESAPHQDPFGPEAFGVSGYSTSESDVERRGGAWLALADSEPFFSPREGHVPGFGAVVDRAALLDGYLLGTPLRRMNPETHDSEGETTEEDELPPPPPKAAKKATKVKTMRPTKVPSSSKEGSLDDANPERRHSFEVDLESPNAKPVAIFDHATRRMRIITPQSYRQINAPRAPAAMAEEPIDAMAFIQQIQAMGGFSLHPGSFDLSAPLLPGSTEAVSLDLNHLIGESLFAATFGSDQLGLGRIEDTSQFDIDAFLNPEYTSDENSGEQTTDALSGAVSDSDAATATPVSPKNHRRSSMSMLPPPSPCETVAQKRKAARDAEEATVVEHEPMHKRARSISDVKTLGLC